MKKVISLIIVLLMTFISNMFLDFTEDITYFINSKLNNIKKDLL